MDKHKQDFCYEVRCYNCKELLFFYYDKPEIGKALLAELVLFPDGTEPFPLEPPQECCGYMVLDTEGTRQVANPFKEEK